MNAVPNETLAGEAKVRLVGVSKTYGRVQALKTTDLEVRQGEFLTLLGPSGSGKTTILNVIAGMIAPSEGQIVIDGRDVTRVPANKRELGMVFQHYALMPHMTIFENVAFPLRVRRRPRAEIRQRVEEALRMVQLPDVGRRKPKELSGGQQQRIAIARCLVYNPSIILMDEPLGALDKKLREELQLELKRLHAELGITALYVTHDQEEALTMSDRIVVMNAGRIEQAGTPEELYFRPRSLFAATFLGDSNIIPATVERGGTGEVELQSAYGTLRAHAPEGTVAGAAVNVLVRPENVAVVAAGEAADPAANLADGTLVNTIAYGGVTKSFVDMGGGRTMIVQELTRAGKLAAASGTPVRLAFRPADALVPAGGRDMSLPLAGLKIVEFSHTAMGPAAGLILADLGAEVVKVEAAPDGEHTRRLKGFAAGFFGYFNRNKRSLAIDLKSDTGRELVHRLVADADVLIENFGPGTMDRLGCGYDVLSAKNPRLIYCALKGFLPGPYEHRAALDEVVQFMGGLAYMTGPPGRPLRAGTSVIDITGGMFGVIAILAALRQRDVSGRGQLVTSALFETTVFLMGQHMAASAVQDEKVPPMPARRSSWAIYKVFETKDGTPLFLGVVSDRQWQRFCEVFGRPDLGADPNLRTNGDRVAAGEWLLDEIAKVVGALTMAEAMQKCEAAAVAFAPVAEVEDLFDDPHIVGSGGLVDVVMPGGVPTRLPKLPVRIGAHDFTLTRQPPALGEHTDAVLGELGLGTAAIDELHRDGVVVGPRI